MPDEHEEEVESSRPTGGRERREHCELEGREEAFDEEDRPPGSAHQLGRRLSAPAGLRQPNQQQVARPGPWKPASASSRSRHSFRHHPRHHHQQQTAETLHHKSASPLSSSASDSAFSRSQTTLGSDSEQSTTTGGSHRLLPAENQAGEEDAHFRIVWRQLSYRVPERRLAPLASSLRRRAGAFWPIRRGRPSERTLEEGPSLRSLASGKQRQVIFSDLSGCVRSGQLTAVLGPSGAGKTTLLKCLTSNIVQGVFGDIDILESHPPASSAHRLKLCIIPQKDYLFDNLTVMENLIFASRIKNTNCEVDHEENVCRVASLLGLQACLKLKTSRLSGGQYKRVSIAQELLSQPDILILDEPTSGLDSLTCFRTVSVLRDLANLSQAGLMPPLAIMMTIHQPQVKIFNLFHHVYVLSSLGRCVYEGRPEYLIETVADSCKLLLPPDDPNPASFIIDLASGVYGPEPVEQLVAVQEENFASVYGRKAREGPEEEEEKDRDEAGSGDGEDRVKQSQGKLEFACYAEPAGAERPPGAGGRQPSGSRPRLRVGQRLRKRNSQADSFWPHTKLLVGRLWMSMWRDSLLTTTRICFHLVIPFVFYFVYSQKSGSANACPHVERQLDIRDLVSETNLERLASQHDELILTFENVSLFFLLLYSFSMCVLAVTALSFPLNMQILLKETSNGWYTMPRFVMAKTLADLPVELAMPIMSVSIAYAITGQPSSYLSWRMLSVTAVMTLCSLISQTQGLLFGAYFMNNVQAAVFVSQASTLPWVLLSGFTTRVSELPRLLRFLSFGSIYRLGIESIVAVRYGFGMCPCDQELLDDAPTRLVGVPDQLRSVVGYYMDTYSEANQEGPSSAAPNGSRPADMFERIATTLSRANTYGADIASCKDVRPFIMSAREVDESALPTFLLILVAVLLVLKVLLFYVVRSRIR